MCDWTPHNECIPGCMHAHAPARTHTCMHVHTHTLTSVQRATKYIQEWSWFCTFQTQNHRIKIGCISGSRLFYCYLKPYYISMPITIRHGCFSVQRVYTEWINNIIKSCDQHFLSTYGKTQMCLHQHAGLSFWNLPVILHNKDKGPAIAQQLVAGFSTCTPGFNTRNPLVD
jgi:hypothetical protein